MAPRVDQRPRMEMAPTRLAQTRPTRRPPQRLLDMVTPSRKAKIMSDTTPRDRLADLIECAETDIFANPTMTPPADRLATAILAAGWRSPARVRHLGQRVTDPNVEATYVTLTMVSRYGRTVEFDGQTLLDLDPDGHLIGVELIGPVEPEEDE